MKSRKNLKNKKNKSKKWADHYTQKAKAEHYPARSVYKLKEIQQKFTIIKKGDKVLDLGCSPGSWLLYASETAGKSGSVTGIDLKPVEIDNKKNIDVYVGDILNLDDGLSESIGNEFNCVISDMAPSTTGMKDVDSARSYELCVMALEVACERLLKKGNFVCKIFQGNEFNNFSNMVKQNFQTVKIFKPDSCRKQSKEIYIIGKGKN